ncbi:histone deacetylase [Amycolatopsis sp. Hca4]|uniref:histone deacetylase n=1 Tax=Amycolatopsis sp. Hca4 TaxID=2742131 RepID=UPI0015911321|nr:histone deacetylase [Amycolatopsis sp. Hca4]QKV80322.1 histone deacetylase [Amycolatopsis sp. Hca4]
MDSAPPLLVWYASYGSNMYAARLRCYLEGGTPPGARRSYLGCRDRSPVRRIVASEFPGGVYFATESPVWLGGRAFFDPALPGRAAMRSYLVTTGQFSDIAEQEMYRQPGPDLDLTTVLRTGRDQLGPGRYETLLHLGDLDGHPVLTFTAPWSAAEVEKNPPSAAYLAMLVGGLREAHGWSAWEIAGYLAPLPGVRDHWTVREIAGLASPVDP